MKNRFYAALTAAAAIALAASATPAAAEISEWEDYQISDSLWELTTVTVEPGQFETYLEGLMSTWVASNESARSSAMSRTSR